jgi:integrase
MGIRKRDGFWHFRFTFRGVEYSGNTGLAATERNRKEAKQFAAEQARVFRGSGRTSKKKFSEGADEFVMWVERVEYRDKPNTAHRLKTSLASAKVFFGDRQVRAISPADIEDYKTYRATEHAVRNVTIKHDLDALSVFFGRYAVKQGWCGTNPVKEVHRPSDADAVREHVLTEDEEKLYFGKARGTLYDVGRLILNQGCRPEEIMALTPDDVDVKGAKIYIRGGKSKAARRTLDLTEESARILSFRKAKGGKWLFPSPRRPGEHIVKLNAQHDRACIEAGVSFVVYDLRHTFATRMVEAGCDLPTLAAILGHSNLRSVLRYVHPQADSKREAMRRYEEAMRKSLRRTKRLA